MSIPKTTNTQGIPGMDPAVEKFAKMYCRKVSHPMAIVNDQLRCVYTSHPKLLPVGTLISLFLKDPVDTPLVKERDVLFLRNDVSYCARFTPIDKKYCFCELLDYSDILAMASSTDLYPKVEERLCLFEECTSNMRDYLQKLSEEPAANSRQKKVYMNDIKIESQRLDSFLRCVSDYTFLSLSNKESREILDLFAMMDWLVNKTNDELIPYEKDIKFLAERDSYFIFAEKRYAVIAMLNAVQNALLYSPIEDEPVLSLTKITENEQSYIVIQIINGIDSYTVKDSDEGADFAHRRCGLGIPAIRMFTQKAGGKFTFETSGSKAVLRILIPEYIPEDDDDLTMEAGGFGLYSIDEKDVVELMMEDVISSIVKRMK